MNELLEVGTPIAFCVAFWSWKIYKNRGEVVTVLKALVTVALGLVGILVAAVVSFLFPHFALFVGLMFCLWVSGEADREASERRQNAEFHKHWGHD